MQGTVNPCHHCMKNKSRNLMLNTVSLIVLEQKLEIMMCVEEYFFSDISCSILPYACLCVLWCYQGLYRQISLLSTYMQTSVVSCSFQVGYIEILLVRISISPAPSMCSFKLVISVVVICLFSAHQRNISINRLRFC